MKANNLSINLPYRGCNKKCPYCISRMTGYSSTPDRFYSRLHKAKTVAINSQVNSVIITGKGEPLLDFNQNSDEIMEIGRLFKDYPLEIQTNGVSLSSTPVQAVIQLAGIDTLAISIDSIHQLKDLGKTLNSYWDRGLTIRITVNLVNDILETVTFKRFMQFIIENKIKIDQLSFRSVSSPLNPVDTTESHEARAWIKDNVDRAREHKFLTDLSYALDLEGTRLDDLSFGARLWVYRGISITHFGYCIQESMNETNIRSLIYYPDGHMSTTWYGSNYGRVF